MSIKITPFSDFVDGQTAAKRTPKKISMLPSSDFRSSVVAGAREESSRRKSARNSIDDAYAQGYKTALLDMLYSAPPPPEEGLPAGNPMMDMMMGMEDPMMGMDPMAMEPPGMPGIGLLPPEEMF